MVQLVFYIYYLQVHYTRAQYASSVSKYDSEGVMLWILVQCHSEEVKKLYLDAFSVYKLLT